MDYKTIMDWRNYTVYYHPKLFKIDHEVLPSIAYDRAFEEHPCLIEKFDIYNKTLEPHRQKYMAEKWSYIFQFFDKETALNINNDFCKKWIYLSDNIRSKNYYKNNREKIILKRREHFQCECGVNVSRGSFSKHTHSKKHIDFLNRQNI